MSTDDKSEAYEPPAIDERAAVGDPLIQCYAPSPRWRRGNEQRPGPGGPADAE